MRQTEQRFSAPQIGGGAAPFKRETAPGLRQQQESEEVVMINHFQQQQRPVRKNRPLKRYDYAPASPVTETPDTARSSFQRHFSRPSGLSSDSKHSDRNFQRFEEEEEETNFGFGSNIRRGSAENGRGEQNDFEVNIEAREIFDETPDLKTIFDESSSFNFDFEPERFSEFPEVKKENMETVGGNKFSPPASVEKFQSPLRKSESYPFLDESKEQNRNYQKENENIKSFTDFGSAYKVESDIPSFSDFQTRKISKLSSPRSRQPLNEKKEKKEDKLPTFTNFPKTRFEPQPKKPISLKKESSQKPLSFDKLPSFSNFKALHDKPKSLPKPTSKPFSSNKPSKKFPSFINYKPQKSQEEAQDRFKSFTSKPDPTPPSLPSFPAKQPSSEPSFANFKPEKESLPSKKISYKHFEEDKDTEVATTKAPETTKKPYNYEKMNFREPLQQVNKNAGPHQIIRIKAPSRELRPQPKQLTLKQSPHHQSGFKPIVGNNPNIENHRPQYQPAPQPTPGQLLIEEISRRKSEMYQPEEVVYDNSQPLITLDSVSRGGGRFRGQSNPDNFAVNVQASLGQLPRVKETKRPVRIQRRLMRLPSPNFSQIMNRGQPTKSGVSARSARTLLTPKFESARIRISRPEAQ